MNKCPTCGSPAVGIACQGCGTRLTAERPAPQSEPMIPMSRVAELTGIIDQKNKTIDSLFDSCKALEAKNRELTKRHEELSAEYGKLLAEHSAIKNELEGIHALVSHGAPQTIADASAPVPDIHFENIV